MIKQAQTVPTLYNDYVFLRQSCLWALPIVDISEWQPTHEQEFGAGDAKLFPDTPRLAPRAPLSETGSKTMLRMASLAARVPATEKRK